MRGAGTGRGRLPGIFGAVAALLLAGLPLAVRPAGPAAQPARLNPVQQENRKPGALDWQLTRVRLDKSRYRSPWIEGYCSHQSVDAGDTLQIMASTDPPARVQIEIFRPGYYCAPAPRQLATLGSRRC